jgi:hypothetical protein
MAESTDGCTSGGLASIKAVYDSIYNVELAEKMCSFAAPQLFHRFYQTR